MSRPSSSVPHQCDELGGSRRVGKLIRAGSCAASQGAKMAPSTKSVTSTTPIAASGLRRATVGSEMVAVDIYERGLKRRMRGEYPQSAPAKALNREARKQRLRRTRRKTRHERNSGSNFNESGFLIAESSDSRLSTPGR